MKKSIADIATIRIAKIGDMAELIELCAAHAAYEQADFDARGLNERLTQALFCPVPRAVVLLAECASQIEGYASCSREFSTWTGQEFLHMDCLFVNVAARGQGLGRKLLERVFDEARSGNLREVQWQTPDWNDNAVQFYRSFGATDSLKVRFKKRLP
jgi:GNAT superfamily N-acetyltransferase